MRDVNYQSLHIEQKSGFKSEFYKFVLKPIIMKDKPIDSYINKAQPFAKPIFVKLRLLIHEACPEVIESIKWGMPAFDYEGPLCNLAAFKQHCVFGFWKAALLKDPQKLLQPRALYGGEAMGHLGRITSLQDIPSDKQMIGLIQQAMKLNLNGVKLERKKPEASKPIVIPEILKKSLSKNLTAKMHFDEFSSSAKREYVEWITEAKTEATVQKRLAKAIEWIAEGKKRNWKYEKK